MKNALISGILGLLFMAGGFAVGFKMMPKPKPVVVAAPAPTTVTPPGAAVPMPTPDAISMDTLKKTSESMMALNLALSEREKRVNEREAKLQQEEDQIAAERNALDDSHAKFKAMFNDFQNRLQVVEANQQEQLQKQAELYYAMGPDAAIELIRATDDNTLTKLFAVMDTKPLAKLVDAWKTKYPDDSARLLRTLNNTGSVIDKSKIAINDSISNDATAPASAPTPTPDTAPAAAPDATAPAPTPAPDASTPAPAPAPADSNAPATDSSTPSNTPAPASDSTTPAPAPAPEATPDTTAPATPAPLAPPPEPAPKAPAQTSNPRTTDATEPDTNTPGATAAALNQPVDPTNIPVAQPATASDLSVDADLQLPRAKPVNVITATTSN